MSSNPALSKTVRRRKVSFDSVVRQKDPRPARDVIYEFSNGRKFRQNKNRNPYT